jgi:hypothetical protein
VFATLDYCLVSAGRFLAHLVLAPPSPTFVSAHPDWSVDGRSGVVSATREWRRVGAVNNLSAALSRTRRDRHPLQTNGMARRTWS